MTIFRMPKFLRRFIRRRTKFIDEDDALSKRRNISFAYAFISWNALGVIGYLIYTGRLKKTNPEDDNLSQGRYFAKLLNAKNVTLVRVEGLTPVSSVTLNNEDYSAVRDSNVENEPENMTEEDTSEKTEF